MYRSELIPAHLFLLQQTSPVKRVYFIISFLFKHQQLNSHLELYFWLPATRIIFLFFIFFPVTNCAILGLSVTCNSFNITVVYCRHNID